MIRWPRTPRQGKLLSCGSNIVALGGRVPRIPARGGFALVVTLALMVLLALLAVGLLSLSAISLRSANAGLAMQEARANARLGLIIALGELQRSLGPDPRVSAPAGVLDEAPDSAEIDGVKHPHWTAVWSTEWSDTKTPWVRDDNAGGLRDRRAQGKWQARDHVENYLVSGNEGGRERRGRFGPWLDARVADLGDEAVRLVAEGSVADATRQVSVKRVPVRTPDAGSPRAAGSYAYWIGYLTQGDVMQVVGSCLRARSDSFVIRAYGESLEATGAVRARTWCEAVVQRFPDPVSADATGLNPAADPGKPDYGRRFRLVSFRWLAAGEV